MIYIVENDLKTAFGTYAIDQCIIDTGSNLAQVIDSVNKEITFLVGDLADYTTEEQGLIKAGLKNACLDLARFRLYTSNSTEEINLRGRGALKYFNDIKAGKILLLPVRADADDITDDNTITSGNITFGNLRKERMTDFINSGVEIW